MKQFLKNDTNHQYAGARPKIYEPQSRTPEPSDNHDSAKYNTRNPTELPDFVQDHLVIEQCYLSDKSPSNISGIEVDNLPDFALNSVKNRHLNRYLDDQWKKNHDSSSDLSFDLTDHLVKGPATNVSHPTSLDLPKLNIIDGESADVPESLGKITKKKNFFLSGKSNLIFFFLLKVFHSIYKFHEVLNQILKQWHP